MRAGHRLFRPEASRTQTASLPEPPARAGPFGGCGGGYRMVSVGNQAPPSFSQLLSVGLRESALENGRLPAVPGTFRTQAAAMTIIGPFLLPCAGVSRLCGGIRISVKSTEPMRSPMGLLWPEGQAFHQRGGMAWSHLFVFGRASLGFAAFRREQMAEAGRASKEFTCARELESFRHGLFGFLHG